MTGDDSDATTGSSLPVVAQEPDIDIVADAVLSVVGVHDLHAGVLGEVATYLPGRRVHGVRLRGDGCDVHIVLEFGAGIAATSDRVRGALRPYFAGPVDVTVEDVASPGSGRGPG